MKFNYEYLKKIVFKILIDVFIVVIFNIVKFIKNIIYNILEISIVKFVCIKMDVGVYWSFYINLNRFFIVIIYRNYKLI